MGFGWILIGSLFPGQSRENIGPAGGHYLYSLTAPSGTQDRTINAIRFYPQPFFLGPASIFAGFACCYGYLYVYFGQSCFPFSIWFPVSHLLWCSGWRHSKDILHRIFNNVDLIGSAFALLETSSLVMNSFHLMFRILRKHLG